jgi:hypothetical protein
MIRAEGGNHHFRDDTNTAALRAYTGCDDRDLFFHGANEFAD